MGGDGQQSPSWFPHTDVQDGESLLEAAIRALHEHIGTKGTGGKGGKNPPKLPLDLYYPSQAPLGVHLQAYDNNDGTNDDDDDESKAVSSADGYFGTKTFFLKVQYDDGRVTKDDVGGRDFEWLDRGEVVDHLLAHGIRDEDAKFYQYLL